MNGSRVEFYVVYFVFHLRWLSGTGCAACLPSINNSWMSCMTRMFCPWKCVTTWQSGLRGKSGEDTALVFTICPAEIISISRFVDMCLVPFSGNEQHETTTWLWSSTRTCWTIWTPNTADLSMRWLSYSSTTLDGTNKTFRFVLLERRHQ